MDKLNLNINKSILSEKANRFSLDKVNDLSYAELQSHKFSEKLIEKQSELIKNINNEIINYINSSCDNKKVYLQKFMLNCYKILNEIDNKIEQEKQEMELLLQNKILKEKKLLVEEIKDYKIDIEKNLEESFCLEALKIETF